MSIAAGKSIVRRRNSANAGLTSRENSLRLLLFGVLGFSFLLMTMDLRLNIYDEGIIVYGSDLVAGGSLPYRDFWSNYGPAQYYVLAALFKVIGTSILVERIVDLLWRTGIALLVYLLVARSAPARYAVVAWVASLAWLSFFESYAFPLFPALLFSLGSVLLLARIFDTAAPRGVACAAGAMVGFSGLFRPDIAFLSVAGQLGAFAIHCFRTKQARREATRVVSAYVAGLATIAAAVIVALFAFVPMEDAIESLVTYPAQVYPHVRSLPFPPLPGPALLVEGASSVRKFVEGIAVYFPLVVALVGVVSYFYSGRSVSESRMWLVLLLACMTTTLYVKGVVRVSALHLAQSIVPAIALLAVLTSPRIHAARVSGWAAACGLLLVGILGLLPLAVLTDRLPGTAVGGGALQQLKSAYWYVLYVRRLCEPMPPPRARCFIMSADQRQAIEYVVARTARDERIFVGASRHDRVFAADVMFYFLAERDAATKFYDLIPGLQTTDRIQRRIVDDLHSHGVRYVVGFSGFDDVAEPNDSASSSGVTVLDEYLRGRYQLDAEFGRYAIHRRIAE